MQQKTPPKIGGVFSAWSSDCTFNLVRTELSFNFTGVVTVETLVTPDAELPAGFEAWMGAK